MRRFLAVSFPLLALEWARDVSMPEGAPLAVVLSTPHSTVQDERGILGNTKLDAVSVEGLRAGIAPFDTVASARARLAALYVRVVPVQALHDVLCRVAEIALAFGHTVSIDVEHTVVCVQIDGCAHLHANEEDPVGERTLALRLLHALTPFQHSVHLAIADGPWVASAVARWAPYRSGESPLHVLPVGSNARALGKLSVRALELDASTTEWLERLGVTRIAQMQALPRSELRTRLGAAQGARVLPLLEGRDEQVLSAYVPPAWPSESHDFDDGVEHRDALLFVARPMVEHLAARLAARAAGVTTLQVLLVLHRVLAGERAVQQLTLPLPQPMYRAEALFSVVRRALEGLELVAPAMRLTLSVLAGAPLPVRALDLFIPEAKADRVLPQWLAECAAELGPDRVGTLCVADSLVPEHRSKLVMPTFETGPPAVSGASSKRTARKKAKDESTKRPVSLITSAKEPVRWLPQSARLPFVPKRLIEGVTPIVRISDVEWWRAKQASSQRWFQVWLEQQHSLGWVEFDETTGELRLRGWIDA